MARKYFIPRATASAQTSSVTVTADDAATTYTLTVGDWSASTVGQGSVTATAAALAALVTAETVHAHAKDLTAGNVAGVLTLTGRSDGAEFILTASVSGGTGTVSAISTTAAESPYSWSTAANWSDGAVPVSTDDVDLLELATPILFGLDQAGVELGRLRQYMSMTGNLGLDPHHYTVDAAGTIVDANYREYRPQRLVIGADRIDLGLGEGTGAARVAIENDQAGATLMRVVATASVSARPPLLVADVRLTDAAARLIVESGTVAVCNYLPGETGQCDIEIPARSASTRVHVGDAVSVGNWQQRDGAHILRSAATVASLKAHDGELLTEGDFTVTALTVDAATVIVNHIKTAGNAITAATVRGGVLDASRSREARTLNAVTLHPGAALRFNDQVTLSGLAFADGPMALVAARP